jgi:hypothetical protein
MILRARDLGIFSAVIVLAGLFTWVFLAGYGGSGRPTTGVLEGIEVTEVIVYDTIGMDVNAEGDFPLESIPHVVLSREDVRRCFASFVYCSDRPLWKGGFVALLRTRNGQSYRIEISPYGGFFIGPREKGCYRLTRPAWESFEPVLRQILTEKFIPQRPGTTTER